MDQINQSSTCSSLHQRKSRKSPSTRRCSRWLDHSTFKTCSLDCSNVRFMRYSPLLVLLRIALLGVLMFIIPTTLALPSGPFGQIMGGIDAVKGNWPWNAIILTWGQQTCSGALINPIILLTAAHCGSPTQDLSIFEVRVGVWNWTDASENLPYRVNFLVTKILRHEQYHPITLFNDIAIWVLKPLSNPHLLPYAKFPMIPINTQASLPQIASLAETSGYGTMIESNNAPSSDTLKHVALPIVSLGTCQGILGKTTVGPSQICAGDAVHGGKDACFGDSGGPMFVFDKNGNALHVGLTSWGAGCGRKGMVGVWTRTSSFSNWIQANVNRYGWKPTSTSAKPTSVKTIAKSMVAKATTTTKK